MNIAAEERLEAVHKLITKRIVTAVSAYRSCKAWRGPPLE
jgi:hypothetical protein